MPINLRIFLLTGLLLLLLLSTVNANPFLGDTEEKQTPSVRPPTSSGFMIEKQLEFKNFLGEMLAGAKQNHDKSVLWSILGVAFLYGILHAAGPGHRKTVIFSMFLTRKAKWPEPMAAAFLSASVHGGTALALILIFNLIFNKIKSVQINDISMYMEGTSYLLLLGLTLWFIIKTIISLRNSPRGSQNKESAKSLYTTLLVSSFFPCPGVIMIMSFSAILGVLTMGIYAVIALSLGMGVTISIVGYLALLGRESLFRFFKNKEDSLSIISSSLELGSFIFLFIFSLWMVYPFLLSFFSNY